MKLQKEVVFESFYSFLWSQDGRIWKERVSASSMRRRSDLAIVQDGMDEESDVSVTIPSRTSQCNTNRLILPSLSAPENNLLNLLEECKVSGSI